MDNSYELTGETEYLTLYTGFRINRCRYKRGRLCIKFKDLYSYKKFYIKTQRTSNFIKILVNFRLSNNNNVKSLKGGIQAFLKMVSGSFLLLM